MACSPSSPWPAGRFTGVEDLLAPLFDLALQRSDLQAELRGGLALGLGHLLVQRAESGHEPLTLAEQRHRHDAQPLEALLAGDAVSVGSSPETPHALSTAQAQVCFLAEDDPLDPRARVR
ncbi:MAG: hypothetical protein U0359_04470 [Byssovorax sp.]